MGEVPAEMQFACVPSHNSAQLKLPSLFSSCVESTNPRLERQHAPENREMVLGDSPHINGNHTGTPWMKALLVIKV